MRRRKICDIGCVFSNDDGTDCTALHAESKGKEEEDLIYKNCASCKFYKSKEEYKKRITRSCDQGTSWVVEKRKA